MRIHLKGKWVASILGLLMQASIANGAEAPNHDIVVFKLVKSDQGIEIAEPQVIAASPAYDNQPHFSADGNHVMFTHMSGEQSDIWIWSEAARSAKAYAQTPLSEFSPTVIPGANGAVSTVRVEADGRQRLWQLADSQSFSLLFDAIAPVGYHAWSGENIGLFVLGDDQSPHTFQVTRKGQTEAKTIDSDIGRCLQKVPGRDAVSYTRIVEGKHQLRFYDFVSGKSSALLALPGESQDYAWLNQSQLISSDGNQLLLKTLGKNSEQWQAVKNSSGFKLKGISRLAVSPAKDKIAVVFLAN